MTQKNFHTIVIGGGCLGVATGVSLARRLGAMRECKICILEKAVLGAGLSSRQSGIVRAANSSPAAARLAAESAKMWKNLPRLWRVSVDWSQAGAIWISPNAKAGEDQDAWTGLETLMRDAGIEFHAIDHIEAIRLTHGKVRFNSGERCFFEPEALQLEVSGVLEAMQAAVAANGVELCEHVLVEELLLDSQGAICGVRTNRGELQCAFVVNAAGGWSADLFSALGLRIPVALEPVCAANWLVGASELPEDLPIVADYVNMAYFRRWPGSVLHMHQPRHRAPQQIAASFSRSMTNPAGADVIYEAGNYAVDRQQIQEYERKIRERFPDVRSPLWAGGFVSYFDVTPDLKFILGVDDKIPNLFHCLGAGQSLKYAPIFGELIAEAILEGRNRDVDLSEFSIARFAGQSLQETLFGDSPNQNDNRL